MADNVEIQGLEFKIVNSSREAVTGISNLKNAVSKLKTTVSGSGSALKETADGIASVARAANQLSPQAASKLTAIATALSQLGKIKGFTDSFSTPLTNIVQAISNLDSSTASSRISEFVTAIQPLSNLGTIDIGDFANQLTRIPTAIENLQDADLETFTNQVNQLTEVMQPLATEMQSIADGFSALPNRIQRVIQETEEYNLAIERSTSRTNLWSKALNRVANLLSLRVVAKYIGNAITEAAEYIENLNLFTVTLGEYAEEAYNYAQQVSAVMGINPSEWMENQGVFNTIIEGFGVSAEKAALMSKNLTQLAYDIASFYDLDFEKAMQKVQSGIAGELEPMRRLGYDLSVARLEQERLNLGIEKSVADMTQAEKSQLRYYAMLTQVTQVQGDMARTLEDPANQLRVLKAELQQCAMAIGNLFIPVLNKVLPYLIAVANAIQEVIAAIAAFFNITLTKVDWSKGFGTASTASAGISEDLDSAAGSAKEITKWLGGFDELNVMSDPDTGSGGSSAGAGGGGFDIETPEYDFLGEAVQSKASEITETISNALAKITAIASVSLLALGTILVCTGANIPLGIGLIIAGLATGVAAIELNKEGLLPLVQDPLTRIQLILGGAFLALGAILAFSGASVGLGIALMLLGAYNITTAITTKWGTLSDDVKEQCEKIEKVVSVAFLAIGAVLLFSGASVPLGLGLLITGAVGLASSEHADWETIKTKITEAVGAVEAVLSVAFLALGALMTFTGVNLPMGLGLLVAGAMGLASNKSINWNTVLIKVKSIVASLAAILGGSLIVLGVILMLSGAGIGLGLAVLAAGLASSYAAWSLDDNPITRFVKKMANSVIGIINTVIDAVNSLFHIKFDGLNILGKQVIPSFDVKLASIPKIAAFADGGFVDEGQLFIARESGAEMVGSIGNQTAVANNDQIVEAIRAGVYEAVTAAMNGKNEGQVVKVYLDGKEITAGQNRRNRMYGAALVGV